MPALIDDDWNDLIDAIEKRRIIPVLGEQAVTFRTNMNGGSPELPLYKTLPADLAARLGGLEGLTAGPGAASLTMSEVARAYLAQPGVDRNKLYRRLRALVEKPREPGTIVQQLASIQGFDLYLSATVDSVLETALKQARRDTPTPQVVAYHPKAEGKDLPSAARDLRAPTIFHLLGRASGNRGECVLWEDDLLDFILALAHDFQTDATRHFRDCLAERSLLAIGLELTDWILLLLLRLARGRPFLEEMDNHRVWLNEPLTHGRRATVFMIGGIRRGVLPIDSSVDAFVDELHGRWHARSPSTLCPAPPPTTPLRDGDTEWVFISYAREDEAAAKRIYEALANRVPVFFDRTSLRAAMQFEREIEKRVNGARVFLSVVSRTTEQRGDAFFRRERFWAAQRGPSFSDEQRAEFYLPVVVDPELPSKLVHEPDIYSKSQWTHSPNGSLDRAPDFVQRVVSLCEKYRGR